MREGHVREVRHNLSGLVYLVQWSDTRHESVLPHRPDVMINHRRSDGTEQATAEETPMAVRARAPTGMVSPSRPGATPPGCAWAACRATGGDRRRSGVGLGRLQYRRRPHLSRSASSLGGPRATGGRGHPHTAGRSPKDFLAHAEAIAYHLGMAEVRIVPLGPSTIRLNYCPTTGLLGSRQPASE